MSSRRHSNAIISLSINGSQVEGVDGVRGVVFNHFATHFKASDYNRPGIDNQNLNSLNLAQCGELTIPFILKEVKNAVWHCFKSLGLDGINFCFTKNFWEDLKDDFMYFFCQNFIEIGICRKASMVPL